MGFRACPRLGTRSPSLRLIIRVSVFSFVKTGSVLGVGGVVMVPPLTRSRASSQTPSRAVCFPSRPELPSLSSGPQGALGVCALHRSAPRPAVVQARLGLLLPGSRQQIKIKGGGAAGRARGASAGSLSRSAGNACQPSRVAPAWAWRWVRDSRWCPLHPRARGRGSPNPHSGSRGASAPVRRSRVAQR